MAKNLSQKDLLKLLQENPDILTELLERKNDSTSPEKNGKRYDSTRHVLKDNEFEKVKPVHRYEYRYIGIDSKRHSAYAADLDDLRRKERRIEADLKAFLDASEAEKVTIDEAYAKLAAAKASSVKSGSLDKYADEYRINIQPYIGSRRVKEMKYTDVVTYYQQLIEEKHYTYNYMKSIASVLSSIFDLCIKDRLILVNPCKDALKAVKKSCRVTEKKHALTIDEQNRILTFVSESNYYRHFLPMLTTMLGCGTRISECCGLTWDDVDFERKEIRINRILVYRKDKALGKMIYRIDSTKTEAAQRVIPLLPEVAAALLKEKQEQEDLGIESPVIGDVTGFIFLKSTGRPYNKDEVNHILHRIVDAMNRQEQEQAEAEKRAAILIPDFSSHILRHTFSTNIHKYVDPRTHMEVMGHTNYSLTMEVYTDALSDEIHKDFDSMDGKIRLA